MQEPSDKQLELEQSNSSISPYNKIRKQNLKICERLNESQDRFLKACRETMKNG